MLKIKNITLALMLTLCSMQTIAKERVTTASWYGDRFHARTTASGERFNMYALTAAHRQLKFGTRVKVTCVSTGKSTIVKINDRGPFHGNRGIDLSYAAAKAIGLDSRGVGKVRLEVLD